jgi:hypothetical protein
MEHGQVNPLQLDGRGVWWVIHSQAARARNPPEAADYCVLLRSICEDLECPACRHHALAYLHANPPEIWIDRRLTAPNEGLGMLYYTFLFHNNVNAQTGKAQATWDSVVRRYAPQQWTQATRRQATAPGYCVNCATPANQVYQAPAYQAAVVHRRN